MRTKKLGKLGVFKNPENACVFSKRLLLRPLVLSDFEQWSEVRTSNHNWLVVWEPTRNPLSDDPSIYKDAFRHRCEMWSREADSGRAYQFGIFLPGSPEQFIGEINVSAIHRGVSQSCSLGYWVSEKHAGNNYMPEAVAAVLRFAFEVLKLHRVQIAIVLRNNPSLRVAEKLELRKEGVAERYLEINGVWEDHYVFAITLEEYLERQAELFDKWLPEDVKSNRESI